LPQALPAPLYWRGPAGGTCAIQRPCAECQVRDQSLCGSLSDEELHSLNAIGRHRKLERGQTLLWAGDEALLCANLLSGVLKLSAATADGREQIVGLLYPADFVGRPFAESAEHTITALTDAELCVFPRKPFEETLEEHVRMERLLLRRTLAALDDARNRMLLLGRKTAEEKVASFLLDMSVHLAPEAAQGGRAVTFDLPLTRAQIADVLGLTIETVSRQMTRLKRAGLIDLPAGRLVTIRDRDALEERAEAA
jgi:CRP/FNR family transcriptional regulator